eukprot:170767-Amphidinium_carterae.1
MACAARALQKGLEQQDRHECPSWTSATFGFLPYVSRASARTGRHLRAKKRPEKGSTSSS